MKKQTVWLICSLPLLIALCQLFWLVPTEYKFWSRSLTIFGFSAVALLALTLSFAPLSKHFPKVRLFFILNAHKRETGLSCFYYAVLHVFSYFLKKILKTGTFPWEALLHPFIIAGETALFILVPLALTSNDWSIRAFGWRGWKSIHRWIYVAEAAVFIHLLLQGGIIRILAIAIFIPVLAIQVLRRKKIKN